MRCHKLVIKEGSRVLVDISFEVDSSVALVGQSGSGKSLTLKALIGMLPSNLNAEMEIAAPFDLIRGDTVAFVPQNPFTALSPMSRISKQWFCSEHKARELFEILNLPWEIFNRYPPMLSGGQLQRVVFAMALSSDPKLLLLDEPTTALDPHMRNEIAEILVQLQRKFAFKMVFVTHDINLAAKICKECLIIKNGTIVERGQSEEVLGNPSQAYTKELISASFASREFRS